jgi:hypothetical protein
MQTSEAHTTLLVTDKKHIREQSVLSSDLTPFDPNQTGELRDDAR